MDIASLLIFAGALLVASGSPGPSIAALVARVMTNGLRGVFPFLAAMWVGEAIWLSMAVFGLAYIAQTFHLAFVIIKWVGVAYLAWLAWKMWTAPVAVGDSALPRERFYVPGSVLEVAVDESQPVAWGMGARADVFFDDSPALRLLPGAAAAGVRRVAWFAGDSSLRSGWAWGQRFLKDGVAGAVADVGRGRLYLFAPEVLFRGQPHGTFKFLFNGIYLAGATPIRGGAAAGTR